MSLPEAKHHPELQKEVDALLKSVQSDCSNSEDKLNSDIFSAVPEEKQCVVLKDISMASKDALSRCAVLLLLVKRFPKVSKEYGTTLIETLFEAELKEVPKNINNVYRRYFVSDALPLILKENPSSIDRKILLNWLDKAFQFYVVISFQSNKEASACTSFLTLNISRPWVSLAELLSLTSRQVKWIVTSNQLADNTLLWNYLNLVRQRLLKEHSKSLKKELIYNSTYLLLKLVHQYNGLVKKSNQLCLLQQSFPGAKAYSKKHKKMLDSNTVLSAAGDVVQAESLLNTFRLACDVWNMLHSDANLTKAFEEFLDRLDYPLWKWALSNFTRDRMIYHQEYEAYLQSETPSTPATTLQQACCFCAQGDVKEGMTALVEAVTDLELEIGKKQSCVTHSSDTSQTSNAMYLFASHPSTLFQCGIRILRQVLKECQQKHVTNDDIRGNICVLIQMDWPALKSDFFSLLEDIKSIQRFAYPCFFDYIINLEMLEEFAYLNSDQGGAVNLDIRAMSSQKFAKQRTVTRGVAKDVKEDFKASFERQASRSSECVNSLIKKFLIERRHEILAPL